MLKLNLNINWSLLKICYFPSELQSIHIFHLSLIVSLIEYNLEVFHRTQLSLSLSLLELRIMNFGVLSWNNNDINHLIINLCPFIFLQIFKIFVKHEFHQRHFSSVDFYKFYLWCWNNCFCFNNNLFFLLTHHNLWFFFLFYIILYFFLFTCNLFDFFIH